MIVSELKFDTKMFSTSSAKDYLLKKKEFHSVGFNDSGQYELDLFNNKIYFCNQKQEKIKDLKNEIKSEENWRLALVDKLRENLHLFCELEYLLRQIPMVETENIDLKLITQKLIFEDTYSNRKKIHNYHVDMRILMRENTPLWALGCVAQCSGFTLYCTRRTVAACTLFFELCREVGFGSNARLAILESEDSAQWHGPFYSDGLAGLEAGCAGVVAERSDVDSAVDTFLSATTRQPWKLRRIFVQESALERFRTATARRRDPPGENRTRFCEVPLEPDDDVDGVVPVEGYRTVGELTALLRAGAPAALSLWCGDVAQANEIALDVDASIVWTNGYGQFDGPPRSCQAVYSAVDASAHRKGTAEAVLPHYRSLHSTRRSWLRLDRSDRLVRVRDALRKATGAVANLTMGFERGAAVRVGDRVCVVREAPADIPYRWAPVPSGEPEEVDYIVDGGFPVIGSDLHETQNELFQSLKGAGVPVAYHRSHAASGDFLPLRDFKIPVYETKVIWTSVGTVFAN